MENDRSSPISMDPSQRGWVWYSHDSTTAKGTLSVLAGVEVVLAICAYWALAVWLHTSTHLLVGILVAPLLLLRSEQSVQMGMKLFRPFDIVMNDVAADRNDLTLFGGAVQKLIELGTTPPVTINKVLFTVFIMAPAFLCAFLCSLVMALVIRVAATTIYLIPGIKSLANNWWRTLFATDILTMPEIIPGHVEKRSMLSSNLISTYFANWGLEKHQTSLHRNRYLDLVFRSIIVVGSLWISILAFGPAYLYRLSIKSTAWVHWPLAYIARPLRFADDPEEVRIRLWRDPREWLRRLAMIITLTGALVATIPSLSTIKGTFPGGVVSIFEYAVLIDVKSLLINPWRVVALVGAVITLILTWYGCELSLLVSRSAARADRMARAATWAGFLEYAMRVRDICGWVFWTLVVVHAALWLSPSTVWLDGYPREVLKFIYGSYLPPALQ